jgi:hypothetical protein
MLIFYFLIFLCQYIYINYILKINNSKLIKSTYTYQVKENFSSNIELNQEATIYSTNRKVKKVIIFLSGGYSLEYHFYINKIMNDLLVEYSDLMNNYELICYEKLDKTSFDIKDDVYNYIVDLNKKLDIEELILFGFSAGGVVASHIMNKLKDFKFKKKIITYNTPWQVYLNVDSFKNNLIYRFDIIFYWRVHGVYSNHYNYNEIKDLLVNKNKSSLAYWQTRSVSGYFKGIDEMKDLIQNVHKCSFDKFFEMTGFNYDQTEDTEVYNIYSKRDPVCIYEVHKKYFDENKHRIKFKNINIEKNTIGHCSDLAFSTEYLKDIIFILK